MSGWTEREVSIAATIVSALRSCRDQNEAINVVALVAKTVVEAEPHEALYRHWTEPEATRRMPRRRRGVIRGVKP